MNELANVTVNEIMEADNGQGLLVGNTRKQTFSSWSPTTIEEKKAYFNAINSPKEKLSSKINLEVKIKHVYAENCEYLNKETGVLTPGVRIVLIDDKGVSYNTSSQGIYNSLSKVFQIFGTPDQWESPIPCIVKQIEPSKDRKVLTLEMK